MFPPLCPEYIPISLRIHFGFFNVISLLTGCLPFGGDIPSCPRYKRYKQWMMSEYLPAATIRTSTNSNQDHKWDMGKEGIPLTLMPGWFFPSTISPLAGSLILSLLHVDPSQRCSAAEALKHPWSLGT